MNFCEGDTGLLKYNTIRLLFLVVKFVMLFLILGTWGWASGNPFLKQYILSLSAISIVLLTVISSLSFSPSHSFTDSSSLSGSLVLLSGTSVKSPDFTSAGEVSNNKVSHLVRFILGFGTENTVPLSEVSHLLNVPLSEVFITIKW